MRRLIRRRALGLGLALALAARLAAQTASAPPAAPAASVSDAEGELARLRAAVAVAGPADRSARLKELAVFCELSGDAESAAAAWRDAAFSGAVRDDAALLAAARCLAALGELDRAQADVQTVLLTGRDSAVVAAARYLGAQLAVFRGDPSGPGLLSAFVDDPGYADRRPATLYLLAAAGDPAAGARLKAEHPASPEARLLAASSDGVKPPGRPLWLLFPGRSAVAWTAPAVQPTPSAPSAPSVPTPAGAAPAGGPVLWQMGLFRDPANAEDLIARLRAKGFAPKTVKREVGKDQLVAVVVPETGADFNLRLKDAGFEGFPLY